MSANAAHRRGSVVDDTCYKCGLRVYLLERHLSSNGQLFHRHCYRDSERTATLQRVSSRRVSASQKENLLPPTRAGHRKSSTPSAKIMEPAALTTSAERCAAQIGGETEMKISKISDKFKSYEAVEKNAASEENVAQSSPPRETCVSTLMDRARPAQPVNNMAKKICPGDLTLATNVSPSSGSLNQPDLRSVDHSCCNIPSSEPARLVLRHCNVMEKELTDVTAARNDINEKLNNDSSSNSKITTFTTSDSSLYRESSSDMTFSHTSFCYSANSAAAPASLSTVMEPKQSPEQTLVRGDSDTETASSVLHSSPVKQDVSPKKTRYMYRPRSLEKSSGRKARTTSETLHDNDTSASSVNQDESTSESPSQLSAVPCRGRQQLEERKVERPKSACDLVSVTQSHDTDKTKSQKSSQNAAKSRNGPIVEGLLENLNKVVQRKRQESQLVESKEMAEVVTPADSRPADTRRGEQLPRQTAVKHNRISTSHLMESSTADQQHRADRTSKQTSPRQAHGTSLNVDDKQAESIGKKYLTKRQAELQRRREDRFSSEQKPQHLKSASPKSSAQKSITPVKTSPPVTVAKNRNFLRRFSKSVDDLSQLGTRTAAADGKARESMTEWQIEAERRKAARGGRYIDPAKLRCVQRNQTPSKITAGTSSNVRKSMFELSTSGDIDRNSAVMGDQHVPSLHQIKKKKLHSSLSVDILSTSQPPVSEDNNSESDLRAESLKLPEPEEGRDEANECDAESGSSPTDLPRNTLRSIIVRRIPMPSDSPEPSTDHHYESIDELQVGNITLQPILTGTAL